MRICTFVFLLVLSFTAFAQIKVSKAKNIDVAPSKTFAIEKGQVIALGKDKEIDEGKLFSILKEAITRVMTLRGYVLANDSTAQLIISYVYEESDRTTYQKSGPLGQTPIDDPADVDETYKMGRPSETRTLIIDIEKNKSSIWTATCVLNGSQKDLDKVFNLTIESAFKKFPAQGKKK